MAERKRSRIRRAILIFLGVVLLACVVATISALRNSGITVSPETTFITGPLREDGTVDYLAALNELCSKGVTPENNAAVLLLQAVGPGEIPEPLRGRYCEMLGVDPPSEKAPHLESFVEYFERTRPGKTLYDEKLGLNPILVATEQYEKVVTCRPWTREEFSIHAAWLAENEQHLDLVVAAAKRPRFYAPYVSDRPGPGTLVQVVLPLAQESRETARALRARAMFRLSTGKVEEAWQDILACHRLARLVGQGWTLVELSVGFQIDDGATDADAVLADDRKLTAVQARRFAADLAALPPMSRVVDKANVGERFMLLDMASVGPSLGTAVAYRSFSIFDGVPSRGRWFDWAPNAAGKILINWNEPMRLVNRWYDRVVVALSKPTRPQRMAALAELDRDLKLTSAGVSDLRVLWRNILSAGSLRGGIGRQVGASYVGMWMPAIGACATLEDRAAVERDMAQLVFALAAYRADDGAYPADLAALVPKYTTAIPEDIFGTGPLRYRREGAGYVLYSVGPNGKDDGGRNRDDEPDAANPSDSDDIVIRVPVTRK